MNDNKLAKRGCPGRTFPAEGAAAKCKTTAGMRGVHLRNREKKWGGGQWAWVAAGELSLGNEFGSDPRVYWSVVSKANGMF